MPRISPDFHYTDFTKKSAIQLWLSNKRNEPLPAEEKKHKFKKKKKRKGERKNPRSNYEWIDCEKRCGLSEPANIQCDCGHETKAGIGRRLVKGWPGRLRSMFRGSKYRASRGSSREKLLILRRMDRWLRVWQRLLWNRVICGMWWMFEMCFSLVSFSRNVTSRASAATSADWFACTERNVSPCDFFSPPRDRFLLPLFSIF